MELKREVLRERNLSVLGDAILAAERAEAAEKFAKYGVRGIVKPTSGNSDIVPMDIDFVA